MWMSVGHVMLVLMVWRACHWYVVWALVCEVVMHGNGVVVCGVWVVVWVCMCRYMVIMPGVHGSSLLN